MSEVRLAVIGDGKMGRMVRALGEEHGWTIAAFLGPDDVRDRGITASALNGATVAIEFTQPDAAAGNVRAWGKDFGNLSRTSDDITPSWSRMLTNYDSAEARLIARRASSEIETLLGYANEPELIHRDNLILA